jgi:hypothetical protein
MLIGDFALSESTSDVNGVYQDGSGSVQAQDNDHGRSDTDEIRPKLSYIKRVLLKTPWFPCAAFPGRSFAAHGINITTQRCRDVPLA